MARASKYKDLAIMKFKTFIEEKKKLEENSLYKTPQERQTLVADKKAVADAFVYNFLGILGLINGVTRAPHMAKLQTHFKKEKQVQLKNIGDDNHDMSLAVKLAHEAGFFRNDTVVMNITKFLAKLKLGQVDSVDSKIVAGWLNDMTPEFYRNITDPKIRSTVVQFNQDKGENIDVSRITLVAKRKSNKAPFAGEFRDLSKIVKVDEKWIGKNALPLAAVAPASSLATAPTVSQASNSVKKATVSKPSVAAAAAPVAVIEPVIAPPPPIPTKPTTIENKIDLGNAYSLETSSLIRYLTLAGTSFSTGAENGLRYTLNNNKLIGKLKYTPAEVDLIMEKMQELGQYAHKIFSLNIGSVQTGIEKLTIMLKDTNLFIDAESFPTTLKNVSWSSDVGLNYGFSEFQELIMFLSGNPNYANYFSTPKKLIAAVNFIQDSNLGNKEYYKIGSFLSKMGYSTILSSTYTYDSVRTSADKRAMCLILAAKMEMSGDKLEEVIDSGYRGESIISEVIQYLTEITDEKIENTSMILAFLRELERAARSPKDYPLTVSLAAKTASSNISSAIRGDKFVHPTVFSILDAAYKQDFLEKGLGESALFKKDLESTFIKYMINRWGFNYTDLKNKFPKDTAVTALKVDIEGASNVSPEELSDYAEYKAYGIIKNYRRGYGAPANTGMTFEEASQTPGFSSQVVATYRGLYSRSATGNTASVSKALALSIDRYPENFDNSVTFKNMMHMFQTFEKEGTLGILRVAKKNNFKKFFDPNIYKDTGKRAEKEEFVSIVTSVMNDAIGTDVEDYFADILETMPGMVVGRIRGNLIGISRLIEEVNTGEIKPFTVIDDKRLREMLTYNDINPAALISGETPRRKKNEKWTEYFKRARKELETKTGGSVLGKEKVEHNPSVDPKLLTKTINQSFRSGKHGDTYMKVLKVFDVSGMKYPEFDEFRKTRKGDGTILPAFHGTGGISASMILRYGFRVIKASDPSVAGRMLGNGIYFSNKIDKTLQYIGNGGFAHSNRHGLKGYIFELDNTLGQPDPRNGNYPWHGDEENGGNYRAMGLGGDGIRSPEWCVRNARSQIVIKKVYEVEFTGNKEYNSYVADLKEEKGMVGFKEFMSEGLIGKMKNNVASFTFRDGLIPILSKSGEMDYVDFEDAITQKLIPKSMIDYSMHGPVVVFENSKNTEFFDLRYADIMNGNAYKTYVENFKREVLRK